ncbi:MAG: DNA gyrase inhibitor YacG [Rudaea sp.]
MQAPVKPQVVKCPQCGTPVPWMPESKWRPFCSQRCKLIDLGAWASERYRIPTQESEESDEGSFGQGSRDEPHGDRN